MTGYIFILLAVACFALQFAFTKLYERGLTQTATTALVMMTVAAAFGALLYLVPGGFRIAVSPVSLFWAALLAAVMIPYYMIGIKVLSLGSLAVYSMFMMLGGMLVPFFYGIIWLHEPLSWGKVAGSILLSLFIVLQAVWQSPPEREEACAQKGGWLFFVLCMLIFFINGMTGVIAKAHAESDAAVDEISFTVLSCALTAIFGLVFLFVTFLSNRQSFKTEARATLTPKPLGFMLLLGAAAYTGNYLHLLAADSVPASVQFPLVSGGVIVLSALASALFFRERLTVKEWVSVAGAFASTFLFAF